MKNFLHHSRFLMRRRLLGCYVPTSPYFRSEEEKEWYRSTLGDCQKYLEYGAGGSTYEAARQGKRFVTVESDRGFLFALEKKIKEDGLFDIERQTYVYANIGLTGGGGTPISLLSFSPSRLKLFKGYSDVPAVVANEGGFDFILVDGRFRIACCLKLVPILATYSNWTLAVDDYIGRPSYSVLESIFELHKFVGNIAIFRGIKANMMDEVDLMLPKYELDPLN